MVVQARPLHHRGLRGQELAQKLLGPCVPRATGAGADYRRRIARGLMPKKGQEWPLPEPTPKVRRDQLNSLKWLLRPTKRLRAKTDLSTLLLADPGYGRAGDGEEPALLSVSAK